MIGALVTPPKAILAGAMHRGRSPNLVWDDTSVYPTKRTILCPLGHNLSFVRLKPRVCTGRFDLRSFGAEPCPQARRLAETGSIQCEACRKASGFNPAFDAVDRVMLSRAQREYNAEPHRVYLAGFGPKLVKVGISSARRLETRWREQGALIACTVAVCRDAYEARHLELLLRDKLGLSEFVSQTAKAAALAARFDPAELAEDFSRCLRQATTLLRTVPCEPPRYLWSHYSVEGLDIRELNEMVILGNHSPLVFAGTGLGLIGQLIVARYRDRVVSCPIKLFQSHLVRTDGPVLELKFPERQLDLF